MGTLEVPVPADLFLSGLPARLRLSYHVAGATWDFGTPAFFTLGFVRGALKGTPLKVASSWALRGGLMGMLASVLLLEGLRAGVVPKFQKEAPDFSEAGEKDRVDRLKKNTLVRTMDLYAWTGVTLGTAVSLVVKRSLHLPLIAGTSSIFSMGGIAVTVLKEKSLIPAAPK
uniref:Uncharacterized protein n=1 Tax=Chromera velia CCMP2878 TaxID=1169474 RepID=A0A0G4HM73_9ALVE|mmetsp:Transcript_9910/g.19214  ORF Transcript_9910/g.19214 Transcript_9910/m.19214 type:complete len:171 (-) Transcript_9910:542-1054(-)|eukprot:Cvel_1168.t1-p1 / transcript=Cvel_1168.t1 / gene=Cvel_1168 / organism=Chromera_velia_CCMP2878 / gene_product=hypothetical protein / transcript_product=hypothetical protein / location=Cvel_scaffold38:168841-170966(+) / protein_length=170 / sequence_SO=supercontig / SO=protein_coding / is_pseudo=false